MADEFYANGAANGKNITSSSNGTVSGGLVPAECKFTLHSFSETLLDQNVQFQILKMTESLYIWIGSSPEMSSLAVAMCTKYVSIL